MLDIISFFGQLDVWIRWPTFNDFSISETIQQIVMAFVDQNNSSELWQSFHWQSFPKQVAEIVSQFNYTSIVTTNYRQSDRCYFWRSEQFFNYMWTVWVVFPSKQWLNLWEQTFRQLIVATECTLIIQNSIY